jgi:bifunctional DNA primase/polymerase-like protein/AAA domain-containing protein/primase-like protein
MTRPNNDLILLAALAYAHRGWPIFPVHSVRDGQCSCDRPNCPSIGKHPRTVLGLKDATTDHLVIREWWSRWPDANVGVVTGAKSGLVVLDIDPRNGGDDSLAHLERTQGLLPKTIESITGGGGQHYFFQHPGGSIKSRPIAEGVDVKADGGYVVAPPSGHRSGRTYEWEGSSHPDDTSLAPLPPWVQQIVIGQTPEKSHAVSERIAKGTRNQTLTSLAGSMRRRGMSREAIEAALLQENTQKCDPPLSEQEVQAIAASIVQYPPAPKVETKLDARCSLSPDRANRTNPQTKAFQFTDLKILLTEPQENHPWLVEGILPIGGLSILGAKPKVGKSTLARNLALAIAKGERFIERTTVQGTVIYLALEEKRAEVQRHFQRMGAEEEPIVIHVGTAPDEAMAALADAITKHKPILVIIDPLLKLIRLTNANDYAEVTRALEPLLELARTSGCHVLCVHHLGKGERVGGDALLGSTALFAAVDTLLMMQRHDQIRTLGTHQRYGNDLSETVIGFDVETGCISLGGSLASVQLETCSREVVQFVGDDERTEPQIKDAVGGNQTIVAKAIRYLVDTKQLVRNGAGKKGDPYRYHRKDLPDATKARFARSSEWMPLANRANQESGNGQLPMSLTHPLPENAMNGSPLSSEMISDTPIVPRTD